MSNQKHKSHVDFARQLEFERKRARGEISCAECRRLKLKCDKKVPCSSCKRRGCPAICPNGTLSAGQGTRFVLADTNDLHDKLNEMSERIRQLEDGLQLAHSAQSSQTHPLLSEHLLAVKNGVLKQTQKTHSPSENTDPQTGRELEVLETFGTLRIGDDGSTRFLGPSAASEGLLLLESQGREEGEQAQLHDLLTYTGNAWPFAHVFNNKDDVMAHIVSHLPSWERASALCEAYLQNISRHSGMVPRQQLIEELLPWIYRRKSYSLKTPPGPHDVALVFVVFALGAAGDLTQPADNDECELYKQLAKVALGLQSVFSFVSLSTVQAVSLLASVDLASCKKFTLEEAWKMFSFALILGKSIGIHRDPSRWNLGQEFVDLRRNIFWELYNVDNWQSLASGRQPIFSSSTIDVEYPTDKLAIRGSDGRMIPSFARARFRLAKEVLAPVSERLSCCATPLKYVDILQLDRKIREFDDLGIEERYQMPDLSGPEELEKLQIRSCRDVVLVYLHRNFFAKAVLDSPTDPLKHVFAPSFLAAYRSASSILRLYHDAFKKVGHIAMRFWPAFAHVLASGSIVGAIPVHSPKYALAHHAYKDLEIAIDTFRMIPLHPVSKHGLTILCRLKDRGYRALFGNEANAENGQSSAPTVVCLNEGKEYEELQILKGSPLVLANRRCDGRSSEKSSPSANPQRSNSVSLGEASSNARSRDASIHNAQPQTISMTTPLHGRSLSISSSAGDPSIGPLGRLLQESNSSSEATVHPDVFQWISDLEASASFDQSAWLQTTQAASTVVTERDLAASLAIFQSYAGTPHIGVSSPPKLGHQSDFGTNAYTGVDIPLFAPQYAEPDNQYSMLMSDDSSLPSLW